MRDFLQLSVNTTILAVFCIVPGHAAESPKWQYCAGEFAPQRSQFVTSDSKVTTINADNASIEKRLLYNLQGNVSFETTGMALHADEAQFNQDENRINAKGNVRYETQSSVVAGDSARIDSINNRGRIQNARIWDDANHLRAEAQTIEIVDAQTSRMNQVRFTRCENGNQDWMLFAKELKLDIGENEGVAYHATLEFMDIPMFYFPYLSFPLHGRKSGFLIPNLANSNVSGTEITIPYYFNIAPDRDATLTTRYYGRRGVQLLSEARYLSKSTNAQINAEYLPDDDAYGEDRSLVEMRHSTSLGGGWRTDVLYKHVSDPDYLDTFSEDLSAASFTHLERRVELNLNQFQYTFTARVQDYQTVDETIADSELPYERLPQLLFNLRPLSVAGNSYFSMDGEWVYFNRETSTRGMRLDLTPQLRWSLQRTEGFFEPGLQWRFTQYDLQNQPPGADDAPNRSLPLAFFDSGLFFERTIPWGGQSLLQTLEPRLFYLYVPFRNQDDLILDQNGDPMTFDSVLPQFTFSQLFSVNRFSGADRVGDANQLALALTSRILDRHGREKLRASVGEIVYFRDRKVTLPNHAVETQNQSDLIGELYSQWNTQISTQATLLWDTRADEIGRTAFSFRYRWDTDRITHLNYRYERDVIEQLQWAVLWPLHHRWKLFGQWHYSLLDRETLESMAGLEYNSCCWALRLIEREYISASDDHKRSSTLWLQLELKGLTSVGKKVSAAFRQGQLE